MSFYIGGTAEIPIYDVQTSTETNTIQVYGSNIDTVFSRENGSYYFTGNSIFCSNNHGVGGSTASTILTALYDMTVSFSYSWSTESGYDTYTIYFNGSCIASESGGYVDESQTYTSSSYSGTLKKGQTIEFTYYKDGSVDKGNDECDFYNMQVTYTKVTTTSTLLRTEVRENVALLARQAWIGDANNVARKIKQMWIGDANNIARTIFVSEEEKIITASCGFLVPEGVTAIDVFVVGGGGGAGGLYGYEYYRSSTGVERYRDYRGAAGGGGYTATLLNYSVKAGDAVTVSVGAGGNAGKYYSYYDEDGTTTSDGTASSTSNMTNGGNGGLSSVAINGTVIVSADGGKGGLKTASTSTNTPSYVSGASGGSGSFVSQSEYYYRNSSGDETVKCYETQQSCSKDGADGYRARYISGTTASGETISDYTYGTPGTGQGTTTRAFGKADGTLYSNSGTNSFLYVGNPDIVPNSGQGGSSTYNTARATGASGIVIIRMR